MTELDALLAEAGRRGFMWHQFRVDQHGPAVLAGLYRWPTCADVVVLIDENTSHAYRMPVDGTADVFAPSHVHWGYYQTEKVSAVWVLRALLTIPRPDEPGGLPPLTPAPPGTRVPGERVPVRMRRRVGRPAPVGVT